MAKRLPRINLNKLKHGALYGGTVIHDKKGIALTFVARFNKEEVTKMIVAMPEPLRSKYMSYLKLYRDDQKTLTLFILKYNSMAHASAVGSDLRWRNLRPGNSLDLGFLASFAKELRNRIVIAIAEPVKRSFSSSLGTDYPAMKFSKGRGERTNAETVYSVRFRKRYCYLALYWSEPEEENVPL